MNQFRIAALLLAAVTLLSGCMGMQQQSETAGERAQKRWDALVSGEYEVAYAYLSPGFRSTLSPEEYRASMRARTVRWVKGTVFKAHECEPLRCQVTVKVDYKVASRMPGVGTYAMAQGLKENWINVDGVWYFVPNAIR